MTLEEKLRARLVTVGTDAGQRIYPLRMPQPATFPLIVYQRISGPRIYTHDGDSQLIEPRVQFNCWAKTDAGKEALAYQVKAAFSGWSDKPNGIGHVFMTYELDEWEEVTGLHRKMLDAQVGYVGVA